MFPPDEFAEERRRMVDEQIAAHGGREERVLEAMRAVPRHRFCRAADRSAAYEDRPLPAECGQSISQPYIVAFMTERLAPRPGARILEVGTGTGYQAAVLSLLAGRVYSVEREPALAEAAGARLCALGITNVEIRVGDGTEGWAEHAPYDGIIVTAGAPAAPPPLFEQLADGGRLLAPVGGRSTQTLELWTRAGDDFSRTSLIPVVFVPLVGKHGWERGWVGGKSEKLK
jgi:protein-L-isoaspartate(D-aspartate) O-methyltransferase